jgi:hypothetical protein
VAAWKYVLIALALTLTGCSTGVDPLPSISVTPPASAPASTTTAVRYTATGLDLCARTDLAPLADLNLTVDRKTPKPPPSGAGASCLIDMHTPTGQQARLLVEAATPASAEDAESVYRGTARATALKAEGPVTGLGDQADAFALESDVGFKNSEYMIVARRSNLVVTVLLGVGGTAFTPKQAMATKVRALADATLAAVPPA